MHAFAKYRVSQVQVDRERDPLNLYDPNTFAYEEIPLMATQITGYFQSSKYSKHVWTLLKDLFRLDRSLEIALETKYASLLTIRANFICLHIRRGDYLNHPKLHGILHDEYY